MPDPESPNVTRRYSKLKIGGHHIGDSGPGIPYVRRVARRSPKIGGRLIGDSGPGITYVSRLKVEHMARSHKSDNVEFLLCKLGLETMIHIGDSDDGVPYVNREILAGLGFCMPK